MIIGANGDSLFKRLMKAGVAPALGIAVSRIRVCFLCPKKLVPLFKAQDACAISRISRGEAPVALSQLFDREVVTQICRSAGIPKFRGNVSQQLNVQ